MADDKASLDRRGFLKYAATGAVAAAVPNSMHAQDHDHDHDHQVVPSDPALRVKALESLLVEKGLVDPAALDALIDTYEHKIGPRNGARVVARAWVDPAYKQRLLTDATRAIAELGYGGAQGEHMVVVENTPKVHNLVVCTLVLLLSVAGAGAAAGLVQVGALPLARGDRSARRVARVRARAAGGRRGARLGQHGGAALPRAAGASGGHRKAERGGTRGAGHA